MADCECQWADGIPTNCVVHLVEAIRAGEIFSLETALHITCVQGSVINSFVDDNMPPLSMDVDAEGMSDDELLEQTLAACPPEGENVAQLNPMLRILLLQVLQRFGPKLVEYITNYIRNN